MDKNRTGVGEYTFGLLDAVFKIDKNNQFFLFYNSNKNITADLSKWNYDNVHYVGLRWPNKLLNLLLWLKFVRLDKLCHCKESSDEATPMKQGIATPCSSRARNDIHIWFSPNLNFTNLSKGVRHIQIIHDLSFEFFPEYFTWKQRLWHWFLNPRQQCQRAEVIITPSENTRRDVIEVYKVCKVDKVIKLEPGLSSYVMNHESCNNVDEIKQKYSLPDKYILFLGTLEPRKNVETIIEAYKMIYDSGFMVYDLVIAGFSGWKNDNLMKLIKETPGVKYLGYVNEAEKTALFKNASLFVFPSLYEGFGLPILEAMACGVPVITSNRSSLPEVGQNAVYYVNPHNVSELAGAMEIILKNDQLKGMMIEKGMEVAKSFDWIKTAEKFLEILKS